MSEEAGRITYTLEHAGAGWCALIEHRDGSRRQLDVRAMHGDPEPAARAKYEELAGEPWQNSDEAGAGKP